MSEKAVIDLLYNAAVISSLNITYTMLLKSLLKIKPPDLSKLDFEDAAKIIVITAVSLATKDYLVKQKIIPNNISL